MPHKGVWPQDFGPGALPSVTFFLLLTFNNSNSDSLEGYIGEPNGKATLCRI